MACDDTIKKYEKCKSSFITQALTGGGLGANESLDELYRRIRACPKVPKDRVLPRMRECCVKIECVDLVFGLFVHCYITLSNCNGKPMTYEKWQNQLITEAALTPGGHVIRSPWGTQMGGERAVVYDKCFPCGENPEDGSAILNPLCKCVEEAAESTGPQSYYGPLLTDPLLPDPLMEGLGAGIGWIWPEYKRGIPNNIPLRPNSNTYVQDVIDKCKAEFVTAGGSTHAIPELPWNSLGSGSGFFLW
tara:strand:+ start:652 stop:1392 length:741 start_codon:yes stop_codon:yes gene_type:complete